MDSKPVTVSIDPVVSNSIKMLTLLKSCGLSESWVTLVMHEIDAEIVHALEKHGRPTRWPERGVCHCAEELGEVAKEAADAMRGAKKDDPATADPAALRRMVKELCQLAAYSTLLATSMKLLAKEIEDGHKREAAGTDRDRTGRAVGQ